MHEDPTRQGLETEPSFQSYRLVRRLGEGGMGVVYEAVDVERDCRVALKTVRSMAGEELLRLKNEFRALQDLHHPNLVSLGELREEEGRWFFTMELVFGVNFVKYVRPLGGRHEAPTVRETPVRPLPGALGQRQQIQVPGTPISDHGYDEQRLRATLGQLAQGLHALHNAGKVHRDIKPSNILVTEEGRLVLLDLGLVTGVTRADQSTTAHAVGTAEYMAPEQAASQRVGPEADWYSVGVVLYEALTGRVPFSGPPLKVMLEKQRSDPPPPSAVVADLPADLEQLCVELLRYDPTQRPAGSKILKRLNVADDANGYRPSTSLSFSQSAPFVGREEERTALQEAFAASRTGRGVTMLVEGESGVGKSALVRRFTEDLRAEGAVILSGRSFERETVPYKAVDGVVDAISTHMISLPEAEAAALLPRNAGLLGQVFPVLRRVKAIAQAPVRRASLQIDPQELRSRLFAAMRELMVRLADRRPVVVVIDDLQWADADSLALLAEVLRPPEAPALLAVGLYRSDSELNLRRLLSGDVRHMRLERLSDAEARSLATQLLERAANGAGAMADAIATEAKGHPLFIDELVRHVASRGGEAPLSLKLDEALTARVTDLPDDARRILELVAVAGVPVRQDVLGHAAGLDATVFSRSLAQLRVGNLVLTTGGRGTDTIAAYHNRVREAVAVTVGPEARRQYHKELALALEAAGSADAERLTVHWRGAGDAGRAARYAVAAAESAGLALAFDHAARLYRVALNLQPAGELSAEELRMRLGDSLARAGRGREAAETFIRASQGQPPVKQLELKRRAGEQYLRSGHVDEGLEIIKEVLEAVGMRLPSSPRRALLSLVRNRARVRLGGMRFKERDASEISPADLTRIDSCFTVANGLAAVDTIRGCDFNTRTLLLALKAGEPGRLVRTLGEEVALISFAGTASKVRVERLLRLTWSLARKVDQPNAYLFARAASGLSAYYQGRFRSALPHLAKATEIAREQCSGTQWELGTAEMFSSWCLYFLGQTAELARRVPHLVVEALDRGDLYTATNLSLSFANLAWLVRDDPVEARRVASEATNRWSRGSFDTQHWFDLTAQVHIDLYQGQGGAGLSRVEEQWRPLNDSLLLRVQNVRIEAWQLRARSALAAAVDESTDRPRLLGLARKACRRLRRERTPVAEAFAQLVEGGVAAVDGRVDDAMAHLEEGITRCEAADLPLYAAAARRRMGKLQGGDGGAELVATAEEWMAGEKIKDTEAWTRLLVP